MVGVSLLFSSRIQQESAKELVEKAIYLEETKGDLEKAIEVYSQIVKEFPDERAIAAKAQLHIGLCYEKLGKREAQKAYEDVLNKYADQLEFVSKARERLMVLRTETAAPSQKSRLVIRRVPNLDMYAKPSPDGKYLAYVDWSTGNLAVFEVATDSKRLLTKEGSWGKDSGSYAGFSAWSPDSKRIANMWNVFSTEKNTLELRVISLNGDSPPAKIALPEGTFPSWIFGWSPDGSRIMCSLSGDRGRTSEPVLVDVQSHSIEQINPDLEPGDWPFVQFTEEETILYSGPPEGDGTQHDIHLGNLKKGKSTAIVEHPAQDMLVGILPGTNWLLFASDRRGRLDLWGVPLREGKTSGSPILVKQGMGRFYPLGFAGDGHYYYATLSVTDDVFFTDFDPETLEIIGEPRKLASPWEGANMHPVFSSDGKSFAYIAYRGPMPIPVHVADSLVVQSLEETDTDSVVVGFDEFPLERVSNPRWEKAGKSIVLAGWQGDLKELYRVDLTSLRKEKIFNVPEGLRIGDHVCAAESGFVYFSSSREEQPGTIIRMDADGRNQREWFRAAEGQRISSIALSPDEKTLSIIVHLDQVRRAILLMPSEGVTPRQIHEFRQATWGGVSHGWAPDGSSLFYIVKEEEDMVWGMHRIPAEGGVTSKTVMKHKGPFYGIEFHPNGRMFAFTGRSGASSDSEVWVMENLREEIKMLASGAKR